MIIEGQSSLVDGEHEKEIVDGQEGVDGEHEEASVDDWHGFDRKHGRVEGQHG